MDLLFGKQNFFNYGLAPCSKIFKSHKVTILEKEKLSLNVGSCYNFCITSFIIVILLQ